MAMKFGDAELDAFFKNVLKPAAAQTGFELRKLDDQPKAGLIDDRLRVEIHNARFVVADLTHDNPGAYWEAGFGEGLGKPVIYTCEKTKFESVKPHFDTNHHLTIVWDTGLPQQAAEDFKATIRATLPSEARMSDG
jgi:nucleoside 2-deoxyribosyltransferase